MTEYIETRPLLTRQWWTPSVDIVILGDIGVGKHTFLNRLQYVRDGTIRPDAPVADLHPVLRQAGVPQVFSVSLFSRPYDFTVYTSTSSLFVDPFPSNPSFFILAFDVSSRDSLYNVIYYWRKQISMHYPGLDNESPVMLLGLKRDQRTDKLDEKGQYECVMPAEALAAAQDMHCDRYAECSAKTGELIWETLEDITRTAAKTTTEKGGKSEGASCCVM